MKRLERFESLFIPQPITPGTKTVEEVRLDWALGLIAMDDLETECGLTVEDANKRRHELIQTYINDLRHTKDFGAHTLSSVQGYWQHTIKSAQDLVLNGIGTATVIPQLEYQRDIELTMLFAITM